MILFTYEDLLVITSKMPYMFYRFVEHNVGIQIHLAVAYEASKTGLADSHHTLFHQTVTMYDSNFIF